MAVDVDFQFTASSPSTINWTLASRLKFVNLGRSTRSTRYLQTYSSCCDYRVFRGFFHVKNIQNRGTRWCRKLPHDLRAALSSMRTSSKPQGFVPATSSRYQASSRAPVKVGAYISSGVLLTHDVRRTSRLAPYGLRSISPRMVRAFSVMIPVIYSVNRRRTHLVVSTCYCGPRSWSAGAHHPIVRCRRYKDTAWCAAIARRSGCRLDTPSRDRHR